MKFVRVIEGYEHLWAVKEPDKEFDELTSLLEKWNNADYLLSFFKDNIFPYTENLDGLFMPLDVTDARCVELTRRKARNWNKDRHASWLRIYAIRLETNVYVVTGGAIKLTHLMQDREHTTMELDKLNKCKAFLKANGVFDKASFVDLNKEN